MKTEAKKKFALNAVPEAALEEAGLARKRSLPPFQWTAWCW